MKKLRKYICILSLVTILGIGGLGGSEETEGGRTLPPVENHSFIPNS